MRHRRISNQGLEVNLTQTDNTNIGPPHQSYTKEPSSKRKQRTGEQLKNTNQTIASQLKKNPRQNHRTWKRGFHMSLREPQMNKKHGHLDKKNQKSKHPPKTTNSSKPIAKPKKRQATIPKIETQEKKKKRKRNHQSIKKYVKRSLKTLRTIPPPQQKNKKNNKNRLKRQVKAKKIRKTKTQKQPQHSN